MPVLQTGGRVEYCGETVGAVSHFEQLTQTKINPMDETPGDFVLKFLQPPRLAKPAKRDEGKKEKGDASSCMQRLWLSWQSGALDGGAEEETKAEKGGCAV